MKYILKTIKSDTNRAGLFLFLTQMPATAAPIWERVAAAGVADPWLARMQILAGVLGFAGVLWGRAKAKGPITTTAVGKSE